LPTIQDRDDETRSLPLAVLTSSPRIAVPHANSEYQEIVDLLDTLIDEVGEDDSHPLASFMEVVGILIEKYEDEHVPELGG
jgi:HTH-type transcriptional regulator/antitoxin HigA